MIELNKQQEGGSAIIRRAFRYAIVIQPQACRVNQGMKMGDSLGCLLNTFGCAVKVTPRHERERRSTLKTILITPPMVINAIPAMVLPGSVSLSNIQESNAEKMTVE